MKRALLVGIDEYANFNRLAGCCNDVKALEPLLARHADSTKNFDCAALVSASGPVKRDAFISALDSLLAPSANVALLYFAGHGMQLTNDVALVTTDGTAATPGVSFSEILTKIQHSQVPEVIVVLDCCFSGAAGGVPQLGGAAASIKSGVTMLSASRSDQTAAETAAHRGLFSTYLCAALEGGAADTLGNITVAGLYAYLSELFGAWDQRPTFKANVDRLHQLRQAEPAMALSHLRHMLALFPTADYILPLDPAYEPDVEPHDEKKEADFGMLQKGRSAKLINPVGEDHLYFAAVRSRGCQLTALGQHYWQLVQKDLI
ncbi:caspase family protein [Micromonospora sp. DH14]|uniref:caspase family protein n=1 Tax=Micromonospora sp. DH14 TaxID=3040120 RepID=UPI002441D970|nr:caspase family protein [Micromonospora sp. DH14]MDG9677921.1 caspase family protein [Micromonospora sp. DH14]